MNHAADIEAILALTVLGGFATVVGLINLFGHRHVWLRSGLTVGLTILTASLVHFVPSQWRVIAFAPLLTIVMVHGLMSQWTVLQMQRLVHWGSAHRHAVCSIASAIVGAGIVIYSVCEVDAMQSANEVDSVETLPDTDLRPAGTVAYTDAGHTIPLMWNGAETDAAERSDAEQKYLQTTNHQSNIIRVDGPDPSYNCHGWVFANAKYWVRGEAIPQLLVDNRYRAVETPQPGDLVIFRGHQGEVVHTALVRVQLPDGMILVESKWGQIGRFVHPVDAHPYGKNRMFYRSNRTGHTLRGIDDPTPVVTRRG